VLVLASIILFLIARNQQSAELARADFESALEDEDYIKRLRFTVKSRPMPYNPCSPDRWRIPTRKPWRNWNPYCLGVSRPSKASCCRDNLLQLQTRPLFSDWANYPACACPGLPELSRAYLMGESEYKTLSLAIDQLSDLPNLKDSVRPLRSEYSSWPD
jgi:hypothetical protein